MMKRFFIVIACMFMTISTMQAELGGYEKPVKFGFDLGVGYANQWGDAYNAYDKNGIFAFSFGFDIDIHFRGISFMEIGFDFARKGCRIQGHEWINNALYIDENNGGGPWKLQKGDKTVANLYYLQMPILYGLEVPIDNKIAWKFLLGPYFSMGVSGDKRSDFSHYYPERPTVVSTFSKDYDYGFKRFDVGVKTGTGVEIGRATYIVYYELGLFNTLVSKTYSDYKVRNNTLMGVVSFRF